MHFHADHALFFERRTPLWRPALSLGATVCMLGVNAGADSAAVSMAGAGVGSVLLMHAFFRGHRRMEPAVTWTVSLVVFAVLGAALLGGDRTLFMKTAARVLCGVLWVLWLGTQLDWASLRGLLTVCRVPEGVVGSLDHAVLNGVLTQREWIRRRDAARSRLGTPHLPLSAWARLVGEGALGGFLRLEDVEKHSLLRSSAPANAEDDQVADLDSVCLERGGQLVLEGFELRIGAGEWVLLCGPSGAGKTSLLRLLAGLDVPAEGTMSRLGVTVTPSTSLRDRLDGRVALLTQNPEHHFIASTVEEDIAWGLLRRGVDVTEARRRSVEMARALAIEHLLERPCHALSFGEQRRAALAGLLVLEPKLLLLDEPTSGLDPVAAQALRELVERLVQRTGAACVWATHDLHSLPPPAKRILLLRSGRLLFDGGRAEGLSQAWLARAGLRVSQPLEGSC